MSQDRPPRLFSLLFAFFLHPVNRDEALGDLEESFAVRCLHHGPASARGWYRWQVASSIPGFCRQTLTFSMTMFLNYLKLTIRTLNKQKLMGLINVSGLSMGIAFCVLILLFVQNEMSFDSFHSHSDRLVQLQEWRVGEGGDVSGGNSNLSPPLAAAVSEYVPGTKYVSRLRSRSTFVRLDEVIFEQQIAYVDPDFFDMFDFPTVQGDPAFSLRTVDQVVITESTALKFFGQLDVVGRQIEVRPAGDFQLYEIGAVVEDVPENSTIQFEIVLPVDPWLKDAHPDAVDSWGWSLVKTYVLLENKLQSEEDRNALNGALAGVYANYNGEYMETLRERYSLGPDVVTAGYEVIALEDIYLSGISDVRYSYILSAIGLVILLIACINFMSLSIGRSLSRSREVGIRKVVGAVRGQLIGQFWGEAVFLTAISAVLGIVIAHYSIPVFNDLTGKSLEFSLLSHWSIPAGLLGIVVLTGLVAGSYPAVVLSAFKPVDVLKSTVGGIGANRFTRYMVTFQFGLSITLIISMLIMRQQMDHVSDRDLGFDSEQVVLVKLNGLDGPTMVREFKEKLSKHTEIQGVTVAASALGYRGSSGMSVMNDGRRVNIDVMSVDHGFLNEMGIGVILGREFDIARPADSTGVVIVNQALVDEFEMDDPIGKPVPGLPDDEAPEIIGVTPNFNYQALYQEVGPLMMAIEDYWGFNYMYVRLAPGQIDTSIDLLASTWVSTTSELPFTFEFLDDRLARVYAADVRWSRIVNGSSIFAVFLALLGLFGLTSIAVRARMREFGIRKVLGASSLQLIRIITTDYLKLVLAGAVLAVPVAYLIMDEWLSNFAFATDLGAEVFITAILIVMAAAAITVAGQSIRATTIAPVEVLKGD